MKNVMLDLETYGNTPGSMILSIGAIAFDHVEGRVANNGLYVVVARGGKPFGLHKDQGTVDWWTKQGAEAQKVLAECKTPATSTPLPLALDMLDEYVKEHGGYECQVWGNGSDFDNALIRAAYRAVDPLREPVWAFWNNRCYRTLKSFFSNDRLARSGTHHNALDDARSQADHAVRLLRKAHRL